MCRILFLVLICSSTLSPDLFADFTVRISGSILTSTNFSAFTLNDPISIEVTVAGNATNQQSGHQAHYSPVTASKLNISGITAGTSLTGLVDAFEDNTYSDVFFQFNTTSPTFLFANERLTRIELGGQSFGSFVNPSNFGDLLDNKLVMGTHNIGFTGGALYGVNLLDNSPSYAEFIYSEITFSPSSSAVPEPNSMLLAIVSSASLLSGRFFRNRKSQKNQLVES